MIYGYTRDKTIYGPVTTTDLAARDHALSEPFLLIGQIESSIRRILHAYAPIHVLEGAKYGGDERVVQCPEDLNFSEYKAALGHDEVWGKLGLSISKSVIVKLLDEVGKLRNEIMHFHPDDESSDAPPEFLRNAARALGKVAGATVSRRAE